MSIKKWFFFLLSWIIFFMFLCLHRPPFRNYPRFVWLSRNNIKKNCPKRNERAEHNHLGDKTSWFFYRLNIRNISIDWNVIKLFPLLILQAIHLAQLLARSSENSKNYQFSAREHNETSREKWQNFATCLDRNVTLTTISPIQNDPGIAHSF